MELTTKYLLTVFNLNSGGEYQYNKNNPEHKHLRLSNFISEMECTNNQA